MKILTCAPLARVATALVLSGASLLAQAPRVVDAVLPHPEAVERVRAKLAETLADPALRNVRFGFLLREPGSDRVLVEHRADEGYITASNMKLISSAVALDVLGKDFVYETRLITHGEIVDGTLEGDVILVGSGDPTLGATRFEKAGSTAPFERMAKALAAKGVQRITGRVIGDDSCQPDEIMGLGWDWSYHADWYAAQVGGLCFNENCIDIVLGGTTAGRAPTITLEPKTGYVSIDNRLRCVDERARGVTWSRGLGNNQIVLTGSIASSTKAKRDWGSVHNPTGFAVTVLRETLVRAGIEVGGKAVDGDDVRGWRADGAGTLLAKHVSPPLSKILRSLNKRSQNLYAEQLPRTAARHRGGDGSMRSARKVAREVLASKGVPLDHFVMADGSGLTRLNLVQPRQLAQLLCAMARDEDFAVYYDSLPIAGVDGTLRRRYPDGSSARGRVRAKTGYVGRVVGLSGYVARQGKTPLVFSILVNDFLVSSSRIKSLVDRLVESICDAAGA